MNFPEHYASLLYKTEAHLGEGPLWLVNTQELIWVDINKGEVHCLNTITNKDTILYRGEKVSCVISISDIAFLIADTNKIIKFNRASGESKTVLAIDFQNQNIRFNDGKVDPNGKFWLGTMDMHVVPHKGSLYQIDSTMHVSEMIQKVTISNGLAWSLDGKTMYYIDTYEQVVYAFDFNAKSEISNKRIIIKIPTSLGVPDGMTIDSKGNLWIAMWGGFSVVCYNPNTGKIRKKIKVDAPHVTSCTFGGAHLDTLFITTAREGLSQSELEKYPLSGSLFSVKFGVCGFVANRFEK